MTTPAPIGLSVPAEVAVHWREIAHLSPGELHGRLALVQSLLQARFDTTDSDVLMVLRAAQGWSVEELAAGERR